MGSIVYQVWSRSQFGECVLNKDLDALCDPTTIGQPDTSNRITNFLFLFFIFLLLYILFYLFYFILFVLFMIIIVEIRNK